MVDDESIDNLTEEQPKDNIPSKRTIVEFLAGGAVGAGISILTAGYYLHPRCDDPGKDALSYAVTCLLLSKPLCVTAGGFSGMVTVGFAKGVGYLYHHYFNTIPPTDKQ